MSSLIDPAAETGRVPSPEAPVVSVVLPCLNEARTIGACVARAFEGIASAGVRGEVIVADNGSVDGSRDIAASAGARVVDVEQRGYGSALMAGIAAAHGEYVVMADADDTYDLGDVGPFVGALEAGNDLVMGNRFAGGIAPGAMPRLNRLIGNPILSAVGRVLFHSPIKDFHCGMRAFRRDAIVGLGLTTPGMEFASEMVIKATLTGLRIAEVPTTLAVASDGRKPHLRPWRDGWRHLRLLLLYSPRWLFLYPGILLSVLGLGAGLALLPGPITLGHVRFDVHTLLFAGAALILGFQCIVFAVFARVFGMTQGFLPEDPRLRSLFRSITLEVGLTVGAVMLATGLGLSGYALTAWAGTSFGPLNYSHTLRFVIPAVVLLVLGAQTIVASFFLSFLGLRDRNARR
jgi:hypothetical protein